MLALIFQTALTVLIFLAIQNTRKRFLVPLAIFLHIIGYLPTYLTQVGIIQDMALHFTLTAAIVCFTAVYAYHSYKNHIN